MADRDVERDCPKDRFVETLRRMADLSIEHEKTDGSHELELQCKWSDEQ
jgi:hypothetical protein